MTIYSDRQTKAYAACRIMAQRATTENLHRYIEIHEEWERDWERMGRSRTANKYRQETLAMRDELRERQA